jgi:phosphatidylserine/phosphatidylglycerophosphate/cardiolipin synthase-like enzyme
MRLDIALQSPRSRKGGGGSRLRVSTKPPPVGSAQLVVDGEHFHRIVREGMLTARTSLDISTADFKAMLVPEPGTRRARSIVEVFRRLADRGVEIRLLHAGTPSSAALRELRKELPANLTIRRCPRLHAKAVVIDSTKMYLGSANLTGAGLGAKADGRRNFEMGIWTDSPGLIDGVLEQFNALWEGHQCASCRRKDICPVPLEEPEL